MRASSDKFNHLFVICCYLMDYVKELKDKYKQLEETVQQLQETINIINSSLYSLKTNAIDNEIVVASAFNRVDDTIATLSSLNSHISKIEVSVDTLTTNLNNYVKTDDLSATMENINASINRID